MYRMMNPLKQLDKILPICAPVYKVIRIIYHMCTMKFYLMYNTRYLQIPAWQTFLFLQGAPTAPGVYKAPETSCPIVEK